MKLLVIDTETGGLDPHEHSLLTYAGVIWEDGVLGATLGPVYVREPIFHVTAQAMAVNRINLADESLGWLDVKGGAATAPLRKFLLEHFPAEPGFVPVAGHNVGFDLGFFERLFALAHDRRPPFDFRAIDTIGLVRFLVATGHLPADSFPDFKLQTVMRALGIVGDDGSDEQRHDCLADAKAAAQVLSVCWSLVKGTQGTGGAL